ncbi:DUF4878 domain-containing protein [Intestinibacter sp.]|uniref:DUF4878 domain-containing protein n=1 Tax=Intestinibacter sp. TaxID=1965304 RepID=UPI002A90B325|nr:DUF4878 domain-containing protein [Intestinibacter sp.]MDY5213220.1 DUF4878 domain-containing protein [Intestinibacter sp.]
MKKKLFSIIIAALLLVSMIGCSSSKPENAVNTLMKNAQKFDIDGIKETLRPELRDNDIATEGLDSDETMNLYLDYFKDNAKKIKYSIGDIVVDDDFASVNVEVQYVDGIDALESAVIKLLKESFAGTFSGDEMSDEEIQEVVSTALTNYQSEHGDEFVTTSIVLECIKIDNKWYIDDLDDDFLNVIFCNFVSFMDSINYN